VVIHKNVLYASRDLCNFLVESLHRIAPNEKATEDDMISRLMSAPAGLIPCALLNRLMTATCGGVVVRTKNLSCSGKSFFCIRLNNPLPNNAELPSFRNLGSRSFCLCLLGFRLPLKQRWF
jgi:hypothetical protein